ncbi:MAG: CotH kinase family protein [Bacteroidales bacterium]|nr:CotH kinase family protein [Bacteroidales bacterium]
MRRISILILLYFLFSAVGIAQKKLTGTVMGSVPSSITYSAVKAFDGNMGTYFRSKAASNTWVGLDLGTPHVITKVGWAPAETFEDNTKLAVFEGANRADFADAIPLYMVTSDAMSGTISSADVTVTRAFRYVRYVTPNAKNCIVAEVEFYGEESEGTDSLFYQVTNLPLVVIHVDDGKDPVDKVNELKAHFAVISKDGLKLKEDTGTVRLRGNTSRRFAKKPYRMKFANKTKLCGSPAKAKKWVLINSWDDKSLMRNNVAFEMSRRVGMEYTPFCVPVDVMVNGEYKGTYDLADQVDQHKDRVDIESLDSTVVDGDSLTGGYLIENDGNYYLEDVKFVTEHRNHLVIKYPDEDDINEAQMAYIANNFQTLETAVYAKDFSTSGYRRYLDIESFLKYFLLEEFVGNPDAFWSTFFYKHRGDDRFYTGPAWDFNLAFDNDYRFFRLSLRDTFDENGQYIGQSWNPKWLYSRKSDGASICAGDMATFVSIIVDEDVAALNEIKSLWSDLRSDLYSRESLHAYIDAQAAVLDSSQALNYTRWDNLTEKCFHNPRIRDSWEAEVEFLKSYLDQRHEWFDWKLGCVDTTMIVRIPEEGWTTLYLPMAFKIPEHMLVLSVRDYANDALQFDTLTTLAEANKPYLIKAPAGAYLLEGYSLVELDGRTNGLLTGTATGREAPVDSYVLQRQNNVLGFYRVDAGATVDVDAKTAYLTLPPTTPSAPIRFIALDEGAGLKEIHHRGNSVEVYSLSGERLMSIDNTVAGETVESQLLRILGRGIYLVKDNESTRKVVLTK